MNAVAEDTSIILFELLSGKSIISNAKAIYDGGNALGEILQYTLFKPRLLVPVRGPQGQQGVQFQEWMGPEVELFPQGIAAMNVTMIDKKIIDGYIQATTGLQLASANDVPPSMPPRGRG